MIQVSSQPSKPIEGGGDVFDMRSLAQSLEQEKGTDEQQRINIENANVLQQTARLQFIEKEVAKGFKVVIPYRNGMTVVKGCKSVPIGSISLKKAQNYEKRSVTADQFKATILNWDYFSPTSPVKYGEAVPVTFRGPYEYGANLKRFIFLEAWQSVENSRESDIENELQAACAYTVLPNKKKNESVWNQIELVRPITQRIHRLDDINLFKGSLMLIGIKSVDDGQFERVSSSDRHALGIVSRAQLTDTDLGQEINLNIILSEHCELPKNSVGQLCSKVYVQVIENLTSFEREFKAVMNANLVKRNSEIFNAQVATVGDDLDSQALYKQAYGLTAAQSMAVSKCVRANGFQLIQGPPGTGKTKTIITLIAALFAKSVTQSKREKMLLCAPSNAAVDELASRLSAGVKDLEGNPIVLKVVRLGRMEKISRKNRDLTLESQVIEYVLSHPEDGGLAKDAKEIKSMIERVTEIAKLLSKKMGERQLTSINSPLFMEISTEISQLNLRLKNLSVSFKLLKADILKRTTDIQRNILEDADIICSTLSHADSWYFSSSCMDFTSIIIDEAAQASEPATLIPLQYDHERCVLVGDPKQLPPTVKSRISKAHNYEQSLFSRFFAKNRTVKGAVMMLDIQFRMHPAIALFPSSNFYNNRLKNSSKDISEFTGEWHKRCPAALGPYSFFNVQGTHKQEGKSFANDKEVMAVYNLVKYVLQEFGYNASIGIISPYKGQIAKLHSLFSTKFSDTATRNIELKTVDGFQGQEKDIIIFSCVRSGDSVGFLRDGRRLNVAITRAKKSFWMIGNSGTLRTHKMWNGMLLNCMKRGCFHDLKGVPIDNYIKRLSV